LASYFLFPFFSFLVRSILLFDLKKHPFFRPDPCVSRSAARKICQGRRGIVWEDDQGKVWLSYNSADYLFKTIYPRHGAELPPTTSPLARQLEEISDYATK